MLWWIIYNVSYFGAFKSLRKMSITKKLVWFKKAKYKI